MSHQLPSPAGGAHLRVVAMPRDANPSGDIFGGWTVSQMDLAGATFAVSHSGLRVVTVRIEAVEFLRFGGFDLGFALGAVEDLLDAVTQQAVGIGVVLGLAATGGGAHD